MPPLVYVLFRIGQLDCSETFLFHLIDHISWPGTPTDADDLRPLLKACAVSPSTQWWGPAASGGTGGAIWVFRQLCQLRGGEERGSVPAACP